MNSNSQVSLPRFDDIAKLIRNFHNAASTGPLYVCTCCEQLWYKHSVYPADKMKLNNPESCKYLQNVKSVDNVKWIFAIPAEIICKNVKFFLLQLQME